jgi:uncharacterized protein with HEPN domain
MIEHRSTAELLDDVVRWGERAQGHVRGVSTDAFLVSELHQDAVCYCIGVVGEAAGRAVKSDPSIARDYPEFDARTAYSMRNVVTHAYHRLLADILWETVTESIPQFVAVTRRIIAERKARRP